MPGHRHLRVYHPGRDQHPLHRCHIPIHQRIRRILVNALLARPHLRHHPGRDPRPIHQLIQPLPPPRHHLRQAKQPGREQPPRHLRQQRRPILTASQQITRHNTIKAHRRLTAQPQQIAQLRHLPHQNHRPGQIRQPLRLLAQRLPRHLVRRQRPHPTLRGLAHRLPGKQPTARRQVQHQMVALDLRQRKQPFTHLGQRPAGARQRPLQPRLPRPVHRTTDQHLRHRHSLSLHHRRQLRLTPPPHLRLNLPLIPLIARLVEQLTLQSRRQILLRHPMVPVSMRVQISLPMPKTFLIPVGVAQMIRHLRLPLLLHRRQRIKKGQRRIRLRTGSQVQCRLRQVEAPLRHPNPLKRLPAANHHPHRLRIRQPHIFAGQNGHAPEDKARIFARINHLGHPVQCRVRVRTAQALDKGGDGVVVGIAILII